jgi:phosphopantothenoylcysteine decarboxylase/phosphopantothenate--cysteine ligase
VPEIVLEQTPDILRGLVAHRRPGQVIVGFAAETDEPVARARRKREAKGVDLMVVNDVSAPGVGFDHDTNAVTIVKEFEDRQVPLTSKADVADAVLDAVVELLDVGDGRVGAPGAEEH